MDLGKTVRPDRSYSKVLQRTYILLKWQKAHQLFVGLGANGRAKDRGTG